MQPDGHIHGVNNLVPCVLLDRWENIRVDFQCNRVECSWCEEMAKVGSHKFPNALPTPGAVFFAAVALRSYYS